MQISGIKSGAVMQRDENNQCRITIRVDGVEELKATLGSVKKVGDGEYELNGIPAGGPYDFSLIADNEEIRYEKMYVGDVWLLGGQSNMEGAGDMTERDFYDQKHPNERVRAFYMEDEWRAAEPLLHRLWKSKDKFIAEAWIKDRKASKWAEIDEVDKEFTSEEYRGVGPGYSFAVEMEKLTGVPQGVIPCGIGASSMEQWNPDIEEGENLYTSMIRRFKECGGNARGIYWDQGEAECSYAGAEKYTATMQRFVEKLRKDTQISDLPFVADQIFKTTLPGITDKDCHICWSLIKELQRRLPEKIGKCDVVSTANAALSDMIHKDSDSQRAIGKDAANAMAALCGIGGYPAIKLKGFKVVQNPIIPFMYTVEAYYENVYGELKSEGVPSGYSFETEGEEAPVFYPYKNIKAIKINKNCVSILTEKSYEEVINGTLWYGLGQNAVCTITDSKGRFLPAFGGLRIKDFLLK